MMIFASVTLVFGCAQGDVAEVIAPPVADFVATDFAYEGPSTLAPGLTTFRIHNHGTEIHHIQVVRLDEGKTLVDLGMAMGQSHVAPSWAVMMGGPNGAAPGDSVDAIIDLAEGHYAILCAVPSPDGVLHMEKGMVGEFIVSGEPTGAALAGEPDAVMTMVDYGFELSAPLTSGRQWIRIENTSPQFHEVVVFLLDPGRVAADIPAWVEAGLAGPPPGRPIGGIVGIDPGLVNDIVVDLPPGEYALICFLPDKGDGQMHFVHGMIDQITVM